MSAIPMHEGNNQAASELTVTVLDELKLTSELRDYDQWQCRDTDGDLGNNIMVKTAKMPEGLSIELKCEPGKGEFAIVYEGSRGQDVLRYVLLRKKEPNGQYGYHLEVQSGKGSGGTLVGTSPSDKPTSISFKPNLTTESLPTVAHSLQIAEIMKGSPIGDPTAHRALGGGVAEVAQTFDEMITNRDIFLKFSTAILKVIDVSPNRELKNSKVYNNVVGAKL